MDLRDFREPLVVLSALLRTLTTTGSPPGNCAVHLGNGRGRQRLPVEPGEHLIDGPSQLRLDRFADPGGVDLPRVHAELSTVGVLTMEELPGVSISALADGADITVDRHKAAELLLCAKLEPMLEGGPFHADPHPGNVFIQPTAASAGLTSVPPAGSTRSSAPRSVA